MSELKATSSGEIRTRNALLGYWWYEKSEADKVISELKDKARHYPIMAALLESDKKEIAELKDKLQAADTQIENLITSASSIMLSQDRVTDNKCAELCHHKYKRCMAMAKWCNARYNEEDAKVNDGLSWEFISPEMKYWERWRWRWEDLSEKFKEVK